MMDGAPVVTMESPGGRKVGGHEVVLGEGGCVCEEVREQEDGEDGVSTDVRERVDSRGVQRAESAVCGLFAAGVRVGWCLNRVVFGHLKGKEDEGRLFTMGVYPMIAGETVRCAVINFDKELWREGVARFLPEALEKHFGIDGNAYGRIFSNLDTLTKGRFGNLIAWPLGKKKGL